MSDEKKDKREEGRPAGSGGKEGGDYRDISKVTEEEWSAAVDDWDFDFALGGEEGETGGEGETAASSVEEEPLGEGAMEEPEAAEATSRQEGEELAEGAHEEVTAPVNLVSPEEVEAHESTEPARELPDIGAEDLDVDEEPVLDTLLNEGEALGTLLDGQGEVEVVEEPTRLMTPPEDLIAATGREDGGEEEGKEFSDEETRLSMPAEELIAASQREEDGAEREAWEFDDDSTRVASAPEVEALLEEAEEEPDEEPETAEEVPFDDEFYDAIVVDDEDKGPHFVAEEDAAEVDEALEQIEPEAPPLEQAGEPAEPAEPVEPEAETDEEPKEAEPAVELEAEEPKEADAAVELEAEEPKEADAAVEVEAEEPKEAEPAVEVEAEPPKETEPAVEVEAEEPKETEPAVEVEAEQPGLEPLEGGGVDLDALLGLESDGLATSSGVDEELRKGPDAVVTVGPLIGEPVEEPVLGDLDWEEIEPEEPLWERGRVEVAVRPIEVSPDRETSPLGAEEAQALAEEMTEAAERALDEAQARALNLAAAQILEWGAGEEQEAWSRYLEAHGAGEGGRVTGWPLLRAQLRVQDWSEAVETASTLEQSSEESGVESGFLGGVRAEIALAALGDAEGAGGIFEQMEVRQPGAVWGLLGRMDAAVSTSSFADLGARMEDLAGRLSLDEAAAEILVMAGKIRTALGENEPALQCFEKALQADAPEESELWPEVHRLSARCLELCGRWEEACTHMERLVDTTPPDEGADWARRVAHIKLYGLGDPDGGLRWIERATELAPNMPGLRSERIEALREAGKHQELLSLLEERAEAETDSTQKGLLLLEAGERAELGMDDPGRAGDLYRRAVEVEPGLIGGSLGFVRAYGGSSEPDEEIALLDWKIGGEDRDGAAAHLFLKKARALARGLGSAGDVVNCLFASLEHSPEHEPTRLELLHLEDETLAKAGMTPDERDEALLAPLDASQEWADKGPWLIAVARRRQQRGDGGASVWSAISDEAPGFAGSLWSWQRDLAIHGASVEEKAAVLSREAELATAERAGWLWARCGLHYLSAGRDEEAEQRFRRSLNVDPSSLLAETGLLAALARRGSWREAVEALEERAATGVSSGPEAAFAQLRRAGICEHRIEEPNRAADAYGAVRDVAPSWSFARRALWRVLLRSDDPSVAAGELDRMVTESGEPDSLRTMDGLTLASMMEWCDRPGRAAEIYGRYLDDREIGEQARLGWLELQKEVGNWPALAERALSEVQASTEPSDKVRAYEHLARIDRDGRTDEFSAMLSYSSILEIDPAHPLATRELEIYLSGEQRWDDLAAVYDKLASNEELRSGRPACLTALAMLREALGDREAAVEALKGALELDPVRIYALRRVDVDVRRASDHQWMARCAQGLADAFRGDPQTCAVALTRAGEELAEVTAQPGEPGEANDEAVERAAEHFPGDSAEAVEPTQEPSPGEGGEETDLAVEPKRAADVDEEPFARFRQALEASKDHLPAALGWLGYALRSERWREVAAGALALGSTAGVGETRAEGYLLAGTVYADKLEERDEAIEAFRLALESRPGDHEAYGRLAELLRGGERWDELADVLQARLLTETSGHAKVKILWELAVVAREHRGEIEEAKTHIRELLKLQPDHTEALSAAADLHEADQEWQEAADALSKLARLEKDGDELKTVLYRLGVIYDDHIPDPQRATGALSRVLALDKNHLPSLNRLALIHEKQEEWKAALAVSGRILQVEKNKGRRIEEYIRLAKILETGYNDMRRTREALRRATAEDPTNLEAIGELTSFYARHEDTSSMLVHLDQSATIMRELLEKDPFDTRAYRNLAKIFEWKNAKSHGAAVAEVLETFGEATDEEKRLVRSHSWGPVNPERLAAPEVDDPLFGRHAPSGFRQLFRLLGDPLAKIYKGDLKSYGLGRSNRITSSSHVVRQVAEEIGSAMGVEGYELYQCDQHPTIMLVEVGDPPVVILGGQLIESLDAEELRFVLGRCLKLIQSKMVIPAKLDPDRLAVLIAAVVQQYIPEHEVVDLDPKELADMNQRVSRILSRKLHEEVMPYAFECSSSALDYRSLGRWVRHAGDRAGLLCCGSVRASLNALRKSSGRLETSHEPRAQVEALRGVVEAEDLLRFVPSEDHYKLRDLV